MGDDHPNAVAYRRTADAFRAADLDAVAERIAEDVVWHVPGSHPMAGEIHGRSELMVWLGRLPALGFWPGQQRFPPALGVSDQSVGGSSRRWSGSQYARSAAMRPWASTRYV